MSTHKHIDRICCVVLVLVLILTAVFVNGEAFGIQTVSTVMGYELKLFDTSVVHTIDIEMDDWDSFIENCTDEEYVNCTVIIDNEAYKNVAIRAKGNTSLSQVQTYGNNRYSFKVEFDHYDSTKNYYGLDKFCLNNIIQDNTYMKDYLTYQMMGYFGVDAPLCSYAYITVNGEDWGLYLAVESIEEAFLKRNYGTDYGELYKPDSSDMGGGRGIGGGFNEGGGMPRENEGQFGGEKMPGFGTGSGQQNAPDGMGGEADGAAGKGMGKDMDGAAGKDMGKDMNGAMGSDDVTLVYTDDDYDSYSNIFENAKTDISDSDKDRLIASLKKLNENEDIEEVVNIEEVIRYFVVHNFVVNFDSYTGSMIHNYYLYEEDGQLSMIPWDYNLAFGGFQSNTDAAGLVNYPIASPVSGGTVDSRPMLAWIFASEEYTELYHQYFSEFIAEYFESGYFEGMMDSVREMIAPYVEKDPSKFCTYEEFEAGIATLKEFCILRAESIRGQLDGSIPSTSDGQSADGASLVDAGDMEISAMGSMGITEKMEGTAPEAAGESLQRPDGEAGESFEQGKMPDMNGGTNDFAANNTQSWILVSISAAILLLGLIVAFVFKRR
ncbi:CotH kinase family protein [Ruminococcus sp. 5_1_39BFAA]|uniref:CotH kinase family protein n=1 Tax=Ruminococcus sp. 5_1_39BFAA TaxID=457412 RepID=UPI0035666503